MLTFDFRGVGESSGHFVIRHVSRDGTYTFRTRHKATIYRGIIEFLTFVTVRT